MNIRIPSPIILALAAMTPIACQAKPYRTFTFADDVQVSLVPPGDVGDAAIDTLARTWRRLSRDLANDGATREWFARELALGGQLDVELSTDVSAIDPPAGGAVLCFADVPLEAGRDSVVVERSTGGSWTCRRAITIGAAGTGIAEGFVDGSRSLATLYEAAAIAWLRRQLPGWQVSAL